MGAKQSIVDRISLDEHGASLLDIYANGFYIMEEKAQLQALKGVMVAINNLRIAAGKNQQNSKIAKDYQQVLVCLLSEFSCLVQDLGALTDMIYCDLSLHVQETLLKLSIHPNYMVRIHTAWCLRCVAISLPQNLTTQITLYLDHLEKKISPITIHGYSCALAATIGAARHTKLGIPFSTGKLVFSIAEDFLRSSQLEDTSSLEKTRAGWLLIGSITTLGTATLKSIIPRLLLLWKDSIMRPSSLLKEFSLLEKGKETYRWHVTLERIAGSLAAMSSFLTWGKQIINDDVIINILAPLECAVSIFTNNKKKFATFIKNMDQAALLSFKYLRLRLCEVIMQLPLKFLNQISPRILRFLEYEFLTTNGLPCAVTSRLLRHLSHKSVRVLLEHNYDDTNNKETHEESPDQAMTAFTFIENDPTCLYNDLLMNKHTHDNIDSDYLKNISYITTSYPMPSPLPIDVLLADFSCLTIAHIFPTLDDETKLNFLDRLQTVLKQTKSSKLVTVQSNATALISASLKSFVENKNFKISNALQGNLLQLISSLTIHPNKFIRCASSEALCRLAQAVSDFKLINTVLQDCLKKLHITTDCATQVGLLTALGGLFRNVGSMGLVQNVTDSIKLLCNLMLNSSSTSVRVWSIQCLMAISESLGPTFRPHVEPVIDNLLKLSVLVPETDWILLQSIGRCLNAIITTVGPEIALATKETDTIRNNIARINDVLKMSEYDLVKLEYILCIQQLRLFSPQQIDTSDIVPYIMKALSSSNEKFRRIALNCLRQFAQKDDEMLLLDKQWRSHLDDENIVGKNKLAPYIIETKNYGLIGALFSMLDYEKDPKVLSVIKKILDSSIQLVETEQASAWLTICKVIITSANTSELALSNELATMNSHNDLQNIPDDKDVEDPGESFKASDEKQVGRSPRWTTRIYAMSVLRRLIEIYSSVNDGTCDNVNYYQTHLNRLSTRQINLKYNFLVNNLSDLIRMSFVAATSSIDDLRLEGLMMLQLIIDKFSHLEEREYPGHSILEQYQAQVSSALRPAFAPDVPPHITANACQVCSRWICSGVAQDLNDLRRIHHLMVSSINKIEKTVNTNLKLYNECASDHERLAILTAWAEVYTAATNDERHNQTVSHTREPSVDCIKNVDARNRNDQIKLDLLNLVRPQLNILINYWLLALRDYAMLSLPRKYLSSLPHDGGTFYTQDTADIARNQFRHIWSPILRATTTWLCSTKFILDDTHIKNQCNEITESTQSTQTNKPETDCDAETKLPIDHDKMIAQRYLHLIFGISMEAFSNSRSCEPINSLNLCLSSLEQTLNQTYAQDVLCKDEKLTLDFVCVMHRLLITKRSNLHHLKVLRIINLITSSQTEYLQMKATNDNTYGNIDSTIIRVILEICICIFKENFGNSSLSGAQSGGQLTTGFIPERSPSSNSLPAKLMSMVDNQLGSLHVTASSSFIVCATERDISHKSLYESTKIDIASLDIILKIMSHLPKLHDHSSAKDHSKMPLFSSLFSILASMIPRIGSLYKNDIIYSDIVKLQPMDGIINLLIILGKCLNNGQQSTPNLFEKLKRIPMGFMAILLDILTSIFNDFDETSSSMDWKRRNQITVLLISLQSILPYLSDIHEETPLIEGSLEAFKKALTCNDYIVSFIFPSTYCLIFYTNSNTYLYFSFPIKTPGRRFNQERLAY